MSPLLTIAEVAARLRLGRTTAYQLVQQGHLAAHRVGKGRGTIRVTEEDLNAYLASCREQNESSGRAPKPQPRRLRHLRL